MNRVPFLALTAMFVVLLALAGLDLFVFKMAPPRPPSHPWPRTENPWRERSSG